MDILFIKLSAIGDVVQTLPALEAVKKRYPDSRIDWVVEEAAAGILENHPLLNNVLVSRRKEWMGLLKNPVTFFRGLGSMIGFVRELRRTRYDMAIDFQGLFKSGVLIGLVHAARKIGFDKTRELSYLFLNEKLPAYNIEKHALERYLEVARYLGAADLSPSCTLPITDEVAGMRERLAMLLHGGEKLAVVNPAARWKTKLWDEGKFAELADRIISELNATVVFTGSPDDRAMVDRIRSVMKRSAQNWAGKVTLKELAALASLSDLFVTTDTGPMHLAASAGATVVALFGPTAPWRTGPYGNRHIIVRTGVDCSPCFRRKCDDVKCMRGITVDEVMRKITDKAQDSKFK